MKTANFNGNDPAIADVFGNLEPEVQINEKRAILFLVIPHKIINNFIFFNNTTNFKTQKSPKCSYKSTTVVFAISQEEQERLVDVPEDISLTKVSFIASGLVTTLVKFWFKIPSFLFL